MLFNIEVIKELFKMEEQNTTTTLDLFKMSDEELYDDNDTYNNDHLLENLASQRLKAEPA